MENWLTPDDSAFYAELKRQILLLTDDDHDVPQVKNKCARRTTVGGGGQSLNPGNYFSWSESNKVTVPGWMERLWAANGGCTGVFIPRGGVHRFRRRQNSNNNNKLKKNDERSRAAGHKNLGSS